MKLLRKYRRILPHIIFPGIIFSCRHVPFESAYGPTPRWSQILLLMVLISFSLLIFVVRPIDLILISRKIYHPLAQGWKSRLISGIIYCSVLGIRARHEGWFSKNGYGPGYNYILEHTFVGRHPLLFYGIFFSGVLLGGDILVRWLRVIKIKK